MKEAEVTTQFKNDLVEWCYCNEIGVFWHKIADLPVTFLQEKYKRIYMGKKKPMDVLATIDGISLGIEFKLHKSHTAIPCNILRDHQVDNLKELHYARGVALAAIATIFDFKGGMESSAIGFRHDALWRGTFCRILSVPIASWLAAQEEAKDRGRSSVTHDQLLMQPGVVDVVRSKTTAGRRWDICSFWRQCQWLHTAAGRALSESTLKRASTF